MCEGFGKSFDKWKEFLVVGSRMDMCLAKRIHNGICLDFIQPFGEFQPVIFPGIGIFQQLPGTAAMRPMTHRQIGEEVVGES